MKVVGGVRNNSKQTGGVGGRGVGTAQEGRHLLGRGKALRCSFSQAVNKPVGAPVDSGKALAVAKRGNADSLMRLVRGHPDDFARVDNGCQVVADNVRDP